MTATETKKGVKTPKDKNWKKLGLRVMGGREKEIINRKTEGLPVVNIAICMNTDGYCMAETAKSLLVNIINFIATRQEKCMVNYLFVEARGGNPARIANLLCNQLTKLNYDFAWMFDLDMKMPPNALNTLYTLAVEKKLDVVAGWANQKTTPPITNLLIKQKDEKYALVTEVGLKEPFKVSATGKSCMLLRKGVVESMEPPWFQDNQGESIPGKGFVGPDIYFCEKLIEKGYEIWIHPALRCLHIGFWEY